MAQITRSTKIGGGTVLQSNTVARATDVETDVLALFNEHNNHDSGSTTWGTVSAENATSTPLIANNIAGTNDILDARDNGVSTFKVADGGTLTNTEIQADITPVAAAQTATSITNRFAHLANQVKDISGTANWYDVIPSNMGKILQVISGTSVTNFSTTSSTFQTTNLSASITPSRTDSKVLIIANAAISSAVTAIAAYATIAKGGSNLAASNGLSKTRGASGIGLMHTPCSLIFLDSPATTSATTYAVQVKNDDNTTTIEWPSETNTMTQHILLVEVAA